MPRPGTCRRRPPGRRPWSAAAPAGNRARRTGRPGSPLWPARRCAAAMADRLIAPPGSRRAGHMRTGPGSGPRGRSWSGPRLRAGGRVAHHPGLRVTVDVLEDLVVAVRDRHLVVEAELL